jgi:hypothetical protein
LAELGDFVGVNVDGFVGHFGFLV